jgi:prepilin-type N-terminal cleavage/methylation domain-containing protein
MKNINSSLRGGSKAFTLVELLIVMAVLALLITIPLLSFRGLQSEARKVKSQGDLKTIRVAIESYYKNHNGYPDTADYQAALIAAVPGIMDHPLYDPFGQTSISPYKYAISGSNPYDAKFFIVFSVGPAENGVASVDNNGTITASGDAIWDSNAR